MQESNGWHPGIPEEFRNQVVTGDARELAKRLPDESVDLIFTDPVYDRIEDYQWLAETAARVLKPNAPCLCFFGIGHLSDTLRALESGGLSYRWQGLWYQVNRTGSHADMGFCLYSPFYWMEKGRSRVLRQTQDVAAVPFRGGEWNKFHRWNKQPSVISKYLTAFTNTGAVVLDPFSGAGSIPVTCRQWRRNFIGFEIDPETATIARERVRLTPLPLLLPDEPDCQPLLLDC